MHTDEISNFGQGLFPKLLEKALQGCHNVVTRNFNMFTVVMFRGIKKAANSSTSVEFFCCFLYGIICI